MKERAQITMTVLCLVILLLTFVNFYLQNKYSTEGDELYKIEQQIQQVDIQNTILEDAVLKQESLQLISKEASASGYVKQDQFISL